MKEESYCKQRDVCRLLHQIFIYLLTARNGVKWTKAKTKCMYMPGRGKKHLDNIKDIKYVKRKGIMTYYSHNILKTRHYEIQHKNMS